MLKSEDALPFHFLYTAMKHIK